MIENALIEEGGLGRKFNPVDKLKVNTTGGEESMWVPEEKHTTGVLHASENGIYIAANDGYEAYHQVLVRVENEEWKDVDPTEEPDLWDDETLDEYTEDPEEFDDLFNDEEEWDEEETDIEKELKFDKDGKLTGKDTNVDPTGNNDYEVGVDGEGNLTEEMIPAAIHIVVPPRKRKYLEGETLDFSGIHVYLMDGNNHRYTDSQYPTGEIPFGELIFPVTIASGSSSDEKSASIDDTSGLNQSTIDNMPYTFGSPNIKYYQPGNPNYGWRSGTRDDPDTSVVVNSSDATVFGIVLAVGTEGSANAVIYLFSSGQFNCTHYRHAGNTQKTNSITGVLTTINGKSVYMSGSISGSLGSNYDIEATINYLTESVVPSEVAYVCLYGTISGIKNEIPVQWTRSDDKILEDTYEITIGEGEDPEPEPDPYAGEYDFIWHGRKYNINRRKVPEIHYANGYVWQEGISTEFSVEQAEDLALVIYLGV